MDTVEYKLKLFASASNLPREIIHDELSRFGLGYGVSYMSIMGGDKLVKFAEIFSQYLDDHPQKGIENKHSSFVKSLYVKKKKYYEKVMHDIRHGSGHLAKNLRNLSKGITSIDEFHKYTKLILKNADVLSRDFITLYCYAGAFNPQHGGHRSLITNVIIHAKTPNTYVAVYPVKHDHNKPHLKDTFEQRYFDLKDKFYKFHEINTDNSVILDLQGDSTGVRQKQQMELLTDLASCKRIRWVIGGDTFENKLIKAQEELKNKTVGEALSLFDNKNVEVVVVPRADNSTEYMQNLMYKADKKYRAKFNLFPQTDFTYEKIGAPSSTKIRELKNGGDSLADKIENWMLVH